MRRKPVHRWLRLEIDPVIRRAEETLRRVQRELASHSGIIRAAAGVVAAAEEAKLLARRLQQPWGLHRVPVIFLSLAVLLFSAWVYWQFLHVSKLRVAVPQEDAVNLQQIVSTGNRVKYEPVITQGSRQSLEILMKNRVDVAFVQGGIELPSGLPRMRNPGTEAVLYFVRDGVSHPRGVRRIMTSAKGQGSHSVAKVFVEFWQIGPQVEFSHEWRAFNRDANYSIPDGVDAVFVDVIGVTCEDRRRENVLYLSMCSDLLGLISVISAYYAQANPSLLYSNLLDIIQRRCDGLKLNIQIKILHASVSIDQPEPEMSPADGNGRDEPEEPV